MKVIYGIGKINRIFKNDVLVIGVFDGLHIGHQKLIKTAVRRAKALGGQAAVMTFSPHPFEVLHPRKYLPHVVSLSHRFKLIEQLGVKSCIVIRFTKQFSRLTGEQFAKKYIAGYVKPREVFVGGDFRFGQGRQGTLEHFKEIGKKYGFKVKTVKPVMAGGKRLAAPAFAILSSMENLN